MLQNILYPLGEEGLSCLLPAALPGLPAGAQSSTQSPASRCCWPHTVPNICPKPGRHPSQSPGCAVPLTNAAPTHPAQEKLLPWKEKRTSPSDEPWRRSAVGQRGGRCGGCRSRGHVPPGRQRGGPRSVTAALPQEAAALGLSAPHPAAARAAPPGAPAARKFGQGCAASITAATLAARSRSPGRALRCPPGSRQSCSECEQSRMQLPRPTAPHTHRPLQIRTMEPLP